MRTDELGSDFGINSIVLSPPFVSIWTRLGRLAGEWQDWRANFPAEPSVKGRLYYPNAFQ